MPFTQGNSGLYSNRNSIGMTVYLGSYVVYGVISVGLYLLSAYLIDRKVEV